VRVDASLTVGAVTESVDVSADVQVLQTDRADVHDEIESQSLEDLPITGRTYTTLLSAAPGASQANYFQTGGINNPSRSMTITMNGLSSSDVVVRLDGVTATNQWIANLQAYTPAIEAIQTVNMVTNSFDAEQGMAGSASVNVQVKSGTNNLHGSAFEYVQNADFRARNYFLPSNQAKPKDNKNVFGGTVGGPIRKNKLFYFASWEATVDHGVGGPYAVQASGSPSSFLTLPDALVRTGDFSRTGTTIYDPNTGTATGTGRTAFGGNMVPSSRLNPIVINNIIPHVPATEYATSVNNYFSTPAFQTSYHKIDTKVNWNASSKLSVYGRFSFLPDSENASGNYPTSGTALNPLSLGTTLDSTVISGSVGATYALSSTFVLDGVFGLTRQHTQQSPPGSNQCWGTVLGIPNSCQTPLQRDIAVPVLNISGYTAYGNTVNTSSVFDYLDPQYQGVINAGWTKGKHNIRFGYDMHRLDINHYEISAPSLTFSGGLTALAGSTAPNQYNAYADFLLGLAQSESASGDSAPLNNGASPQRPETLRSWEFGLYVRDQWQVNRKLTVTAGLRWEHYPVPTRADRGIEFFNFNTLKEDICGVGGNPENCGISVSPLLFSPRFGIAYRVAEGLVIRTGFSLNWQQDNMYRSPIYDYPGVVSTSVVGANSYSAAGNISNGLPILPVPNTASGFVTVPAGTSITTSPQNFRRGYIMDGNLTIEKSLGHGFLLNAGYVGNRAIRLFTSQAQNYGLPGGGTASQRLFSEFGTGSVSILLPMQHTHYDSLQATLKRRFSSGLSVFGSYTFSKASTNFAGSIPIPAYFWHDHGLQGANQADHLSLAANYELPFGKGKAFLKNVGFISELVSHWQLNDLFTWYTGTPFTVSASSASLNAPGSSQTADQVVPLVQILNGVGGLPYFNPLAFASVTQARFGTSGFNILFGPGVFNDDLSLFRTFRLTEKFQLQFRAEAFNVSNTAQFANPSGLSVSSMQLNSDGTVKNLNGFDEITGTNATGRDFSERYLRLGLRLSF
jgi:hypothetical protein